jgi:hypothetical protein
VWDGWGVGAVAAAAAVVFSSFSVTPLNPLYPLFPLSLTWCGASVTVGVVTGPYALAGGSMTKPGPADDVVAAAPVAVRDMG